MKKRVYLILLMIVMAVSAVSAQQTLDGVLAVVGDHIILKSELLQQSQMMAMQRRIEIGSEDYEQLQRRVLDELINQKVLLIKAVEDTVTVDDEHVEAELQKRIDMAIEQYGSVEKVEEYFNSPINKIKRNYREEMKNTLIVEQVRGMKKRGINISRAEVEEFYNTMKDSIPNKTALVKLRHILLEIKPGGSAYDAGMKKAAEVQKKLAEGETFESLAAEYSEDPGTKDLGGDIGWLERGSFDAAFEEAAFNLEPGQISDVVQSAIGLHIIKSEEKEENRVHVRHVFFWLKASENDDEATRQRIQSLHDRITQGAAFDSLALAYSDDPTTNLAGGDLGWIPLNQLQIDTFKQVVDTLQVGHVSAPFKTRFGYHIVFKEEEQAERPVSLEEDYNDLKNYALRMKQDRIEGEWLESLKSKIYIEIKEELL